MSAYKSLHDQQLKKFTREKSLWEKQKKASEILPNKRERQEIEHLTQEIQDCQEQARQREARLHLTVDRLKKKMQELDKTNKELIGEIGVLERERASRLQVHIKSNIMEDAGPALTKSKSVDQLCKKSIKTRDLLGSSASHPNLPNPTSKTSQSPSFTLKSNIPKLTAIPMSSPTSTRKVLGGMVKFSDPPALPISEKKSKIDPSKCDLDQLQKELHLEHPIKENVLEDGSRSRLFADGTILQWLNDGKMKLVRIDGISVVYFSNGDSKTVFPDERVVYWYNKSKTRHTTYSDGLQVCEYDDGQLEEIHTDGRHIVQFADGIVKTILPVGKVVYLKLIVGVSAVS
jgi:hypothetical protein